ncbi:MAG: fibrobacter succinogenes major paralogous domain-containing protein [Bacteroidetes bacterium]|nr:fibrobacter succinogenes major paralogous domain-containing protein [Bacteroidota bacterium]
MVKWLLAVIITFSFISFTQNDWEFIRGKDGFQYGVTDIGNQKWMAENLRDAHFRNGDSILEIRSWKEWEIACQEAIPAWVPYDYHHDNATKACGRLYNYWAIVDPRGIAPEGWHVATMKDWGVLSNYLGDSICGQKMKWPDHWETNTGTNLSRFSALPCGCRSKYAEYGYGEENLGHFYGRRKMAAFWGVPNSYYGLFGIQLKHTSNMQSKLNQNLKLTYGLSVRCVFGDENLHTTKHDGSLRDIDGNYYRYARIGRTEWMTTNLKVTHFQNGDPIYFAQTDEEWMSAAEKKIPAYCKYEGNSRHNDFDNPDHGYLYNYYAVSDQRGLSPLGWKIPNSTAFKLLENTGPKNVKMPWTEFDEYFYATYSSSKHFGQNKSGFNALASGHRALTKNYIYGLKEYPNEKPYEHCTFSSKALSAEFWCIGSGATESLTVGIYDGKFNFAENQDKGDGYVVRCYR